MMGDRAALFYYVALVDESGRAAPVDLSNKVTQFTFTDREGGMDKLQLTVDNKDLSNFDDPVFEYGAKLRVSWGNGITTAPVRDMVVRKVTGGRTLTVSCVGKTGAALDTEKKRRCFFSVSRSDVVRQIAREHGFREPDIEDTPEVFAEITQGNLTDGQFLRKLAHLEGFEFFIDWDGLHWHRRRVGQAPVRQYTYFIDRRGGEIIDFNVTNDVTRRPGKVTVKSRDPLAKTDIEASASNTEDVDRDVMAGFTGTIDGETGQLVLKKEVAYEQTIASNVETQQDAEREAKGKYRKASQGVVKMTLQVRGDPSLVAKTVITLNGFGRRLSGKYYVREVTHSLSASGGYSMGLKVITDGFQSRGRGGSSSANSANGAAFSELAAQLSQAATSDFSASIDGETGQLSINGSKFQAVVSQADRLGSALTTLTNLEGDELRKACLSAARSFRQLASSASASGAKSIASVAGNIAATCQRIAENPGDPKAAGNQNKKQQKDSEVTTVNGVDLDGNPITTFVNTGGRES